MSAPEKYVLGGEARPERRDQAVLTRREPVASQKTLEDEHHRDAGHIAALTEYLPRKGESSRPKTERLLEGDQYSATPGVDEVVLYVPWGDARRGAGRRNVLGHPSP